MFEAVESNDDDDLPGMWSHSDFMGGETDNEIETKSESYTWDSDEGIKAVIDRVRESGEPYMLGLNPSDLEVVMLALYDYVMQSSKDENVYVTAVEDILSGIAESVGVDWV